MARRRLPIDAEHPAYDPGACGPDGLPRCRRCLREIHARRSDGFCSDACRHDALMRTSATYARAAVFARDRGVCTHCRAACGLLDRVIRRLCASGVRTAVGGDMGEDMGEDAEPGTDAESDEAREAARQLALRTIELLGFGRRTRVISLWQADHRLAIAEGGRDCGLGNYRTLCLNCHALQTRELHRRLRHERHAQA